MSVWKLKALWDCLFYFVINLIVMGKFFIEKYFFKKKKHLSDNICYKNKHVSERCFVIGNGPSLSEFDLTHLVNDCCFFVNRAYLHENYEFLKPRYHVFIDSKLIDGTWDIDCLDYILKINENVIFILNSNWIDDPRLAKYNNIIWIEAKLFMNSFLDEISNIDISRVTYGNAVLGAAMSVAAYMGFSTIYIMGNDADGLCHEIVGSRSHFYGVNNENNNKNFQDVILDLHTMSHSLHCWTVYEKHFKRNGIKVYNTNQNGYFDAFDRVDYFSLF